MTKHDEAETARHSGFAVANNARVINIAKQQKVIAEGVIGGLERETTNENLPANRTKHEVN
jgi:hypothetical protein